MIGASSARVGAPGEPVYQVVLSTVGDSARNERVRDVVARARGDLKSLDCNPLRRPPRIQLHLGRRRIDDVLGALESAGFDVTAVIALPA